MGDADDDNDLSRPINFLNFCLHRESNSFLCHDFGAYCSRLLSLFGEAINLFLAPFAVSNPCRASTSTHLFAFLS